MIILLLRKRHHQSRRSTPLRGCHLTRLPTATLMDLEREHPAF